MEAVTHKLENLQWPYEAPGALVPKQALVFWKALIAKYPNIPIPHVGSYGMGLCVEFKWHREFDNDPKLYCTYIDILDTELEGKVLCRLNSDECDQIELYLPDQLSECIDKVVKYLRL